MTMITMLLAAATLTSAAPAVAQSPLASAKAPPSQYAVRYDKIRDRYCVRDRNAKPTTGSMLVPEECKSDSEWASEGLYLNRKR